MAAITPDYWRRLEAVFHAALQLPAADRGEYLAHACAGEDELLRQVESLILSSDETHHIMDGVIDVKGNDDGELGDIFVHSLRIDRISSRFLSPLEGLCEDRNMRDLPAPEARRREEDPGP